MSNRSNSEQSKTVVDAYYQAGVEGRLRELARYLHPDFTTTAPNYLPSGGFPSVGRHESGTGKLSARDHVTSP
jgi:hypothetical protein